MNARDFTLIILALTLTLIAGIGIGRAIGLQEIEDRCAFTQ
jgi:CRISPR/Cas system endoribonuclease Cas6 (RAMP superfamily)